MNRTGLIFLLLLGLGLAGGTPGEGPRVARRARPDAGQAELEADLPLALPVVAAAAGSLLGFALPATGALPLRDAAGMRAAEAPLSCCCPAEPAGVPACSRAPPFPG